MTDRTRLWPVWLVVALLSAASVLGQSPLAPRSGTGVVASPNTPLIEPLREPRFVPAAQADFLKGEDRVLGVSGNGVAKAYLPAAVAFHHIIDDQLGAMPIMVTW